MCDRMYTKKVIKDMQTIASATNHRYHDEIAQAQVIRVEQFVRWLRSIAATIEEEVEKSPSEWGTPQSLSEWIDETKYM